MIQWNTLASIAEVEALIEHSKTQACLIFKHSTRCSISSIAKSRLEKTWDADTSSIAPYFLDLIAHRDVSNFIADKFGVSHESPQVLLIKRGVCSYHDSHLGINVNQIHQQV